MERFDNLLAQFVEGALSGAESRELLALLRGSAAHRRALIRELDFAAELSANLGMRPDAFVRQVIARIGDLDSLETERFEESVMDRIDSNRERGVPAEARRAAATPSASAGRRPVRTGRRNAGAARTVQWPRWITMAAAAVLLVLGAALVRVWEWLPALRPGSAPAVATVEAVSGDAVLAAGSARAPLRVRQALTAGDTVETGAGSARVTLAWADGSRLDVRQQTRLRVETESVLAMARGELTAGIAPRPAGQTLRITTPHADLTVLGTRYTVCVDDTHTDVHVLEGQVLLASRLSADSVRLAAGQSATAGGRIRVAGQPAAGAAGTLPGRTARGLLALYTFREGSGRTIQDVSGVGLPLNLTLRGNDYHWLPGGGLAFNHVWHRSIATSQRPARKLYSGAAASGEVSVEVWIRSGDLQQPGPGRTGPNRIIAFDDPLGEPANTQNWLLGQANYENFGEKELSFRLAGSGEGALPQLTTSTQPLESTRTLYHIVAAYSPAGGRQIYVNGRLCAADQTPHKPGRSIVGVWRPDYPLSIGNRTTSLDRGWYGAIFLAAVYNCALTPEEIAGNCEAGLPGSTKERAGLR
ncbi:MAG: FecR domain-containing protein [Kiritimatiellae bacterium]|nr:FecR domain-containing protein [Kiritimatiellia bacterium]